MKTPVLGDTRKPRYCPVCGFDYRIGMPISRCPNAKCPEPDRGLETAPPSTTQEQESP